jgi:hypothetical protein
MMVFITIFLTGLVALLILFKIYKRSISTTIAIVTVAISMNLRLYGYCLYADIVLLPGMIILLVRGMIKPDNDSFVVRTKKC